ncbi:hypothetical protein AOLI_G00068010 [Acnodon oligacanthus]
MLPHMYSVTSQSPVSSVTSQRPLTSMTVIPQGPVTALRKLCVPPVDVRKDMIAHFPVKWKRGRRRRCDKGYTPPSAGRAVCVCAFQKKGTAFWSTTVHKHKCLSPSSPANPGPAGASRVIINYDMYCYQALTEWA